jgi:outer membrane lipoprotein LolB
MIRGAVLALVAMLLTGCATFMKNEQKTAQANWTQHRAALAHVDRFVLRARVSSGSMFGMRGDLRWQQNPDGSFELRVSGPFGIGALTIAGTETEVEVRTKNGVYRTSDPEKWVRDKMGWSFPILGLRYWVMGLPWPHSQSQLELSLDGQAVVLQQDGWRMDYKEYGKQGALTLPKKFEIANPEVKIKVVVDGWDELPTQVAKR